jgi:hypothetical protein
MALGTLYKGTTFNFRDSYAFIPQQLATFPKMFDLEAKEKEIFPYSAASKETIEADKVDLNEAIEIVKSSGKSVEDFLRQASDFIFEDDYPRKKFLKIRSYSSKYCKIDVDILQQGFEKFRTYMKTVLIDQILNGDPEGLAENFDILQYMTISSLSYAFLGYAQLDGITEKVKKVINDEHHDTIIGQKYKTAPTLADIPEMNAINSNYIRQSMVGGRTVTRNNKLQDCRELRLSDEDFSSQYPAAFICRELAHIPLGLPIKLIVPECLNEKVYTSVEELRKDHPQTLGNVIDPQQDAYAKNQPGGLVHRSELTNDISPWFFLTVKILKVNKPRTIANLSHRSATVADEEANGESSLNNRHWEDKPGTYVLNHIQLEDLCEFQGIEFEICGGIYFEHNPNGFASLRTFTQTLFNARSVFKKQKNPIEKCLKLVLNSFYGKMIEKFRPTEEVIRTNTPAEFQEYLEKNFMEIESYLIVDAYNRVYKRDEIKPENEIKTYRVTKRKSSGIYSSKAHIASVMYAEQSYLFT